MHFELDKEQGHTGYSRSVSTYCCQPEAKRIHMNQLKITANLYLNWYMCYKIKGKFITRGHTRKMTEEVRLCSEKQTGFDRGKRVLG